MLKAYSLARRALTAVGSRCMSIWPFFGGHPAEAPLAPVRPEDVPRIRAEAADAVADDAKPVVFFVPGFMGSKLTVDGVPTFNVRALIQGAMMHDESHLANMANLERPYDVRVPGLMDGEVGYMDLREKLSDICREAGWDGPVVCPYDWRQPVDFVAQAWVAPRIWQHVGNKKKAIIIGHSMGNLVTRYFLERMGGADVSLMHIAVAAPFKGAPSSLQALLLGGTILNYGLAWRTMNSVSKVIPGLRQLLPRYPCIQQFDGFLADVREDMLPAPPQPPPAQLPVDALAAGKYQLYVLLNNSIPTLTHLVDNAGTCVLPDGHPPRVGDNTVPWQSAWTNIEGVRHYLVNAPHNDMAQHTTTYSLLRQLLPLATCSTDELKARLDQVTQRTFIAGAPGEPEPDLDVHRPTLLARFERFYAEQAPLSFRLALTMGRHRVLVTVHDSSNTEVLSREVDVPEGGEDLSLDAGLGEGTYQVTVAPMIAEEAPTAEAAPAHGAGPYQAFFQVVPPEVASKLGPEME